MSHERIPIFENFRSGTGAGEDGTTLSPEEVKFTRIINESHQMYYNWGSSDFWAVQGEDFLTNPDHRAVVDSIRMESIFDMPCCTSADQVVAIAASGVDVCIFGYEGMNKNIVNTHAMYEPGGIEARSEYLRYLHECIAEIVKDEPPLHGQIGRVRFPDVTLDGPAAEDDIAREAAKTLVPPRFIDFTKAPETDSEGKPLKPNQLKFWKTLAEGCQAYHIWDTGDTWAVAGDNPSADNSHMVGVNYFGYAQTLGVNYWDGTDTVLGLAVSGKDVHVQFERKGAGGVETRPEEEKIREAMRKHVNLYPSDIPLGKIIFEYFDPDAPKIK